MKRVEQCEKPQCVHEVSEKLDALFSGEIVQIGNSLIGGSFCENKDCVIVCFANLGARVEKGRKCDLSDFWGLKFCSSMGYNVISIVPYEIEDWYLGAELELFIRDLGSRLEGYSEVIGYGGSMGGYGVARFSRFLRMSRFLIFNPISTLHSEVASFETRFEVARKLNWTAKDDAANSVSDGFLVFDPLYSLDAQHACRFDPRITRLRLYGVGHEIPRWLKEMKCLKDIAILFFEGRLNAGKFYEFAQKRKKLPRHYSWLLSRENKRLNRYRWRKIVFYMFRKSELGFLVGFSVLIEALKEAVKHKLKGDVV